MISDNADITAPLSQAVALYLLRLFVWQGPPRRHRCLQAAPLSLCAITLASLACASSPLPKPADGARAAPPTSPSCDSIVDTATSTHRLDLVALAVLCIDGPAALTQLKKQLGEKRTIFLLPAHVAADLRAEPPRGERHHDLYVVPDADRPRLAKIYPIEPYLGSGGAISFLTLQWGIRGHREVTRDALRALKRRPSAWNGITHDAEVILTDASTDPDWRQWIVPEAHAFTRHDPSTGHPEPDAAIGPRRWTDWIRRNIDRALAAARTGHFDEALYRIGYAAHAVQDLATNGGMTSVAKSYLEFVRGDNSDEDTDLIQDAQTLTEVFFESVALRFTKDEWAKMMQWSGDADSDMEFDPVDFGLPALLEHIRSGSRFADVAREQLKARSPWCPRDRCEALVRAAVSTSSPVTQP